MRPSVVLQQQRHAVREAVQRFRTVNPRVFGSVLHGTDQEGSDLDLLVDALPGTTLKAPGSPACIEHRLITAWSSARTLRETMLCTAVMMCAATSTGSTVW